MFLKLLSLVVITIIGIVIVTVPVLREEIPPSRVIYFVFGTGIVLTVFLLIVYNLFERRQKNELVYPVSPEDATLPEGIALKFCEMVVHNYPRIPIINVLNILVTDIKTLLETRVKDANKLVAVKDYGLPTEEGTYVVLAPTWNGGRPVIVSLKEGRFYDEDFIDDTGDITSEVTHYMRLNLQSTEYV